MFLCVELVAFCWAGEVRARGGVGEGAESG